MKSSCFFTIISAVFMTISAQSCSDANSQPGPASGFLGSCTGKPVSNGTLSVCAEFTYREKNAGSLNKAFVEDEVCEKENKFSLTERCQSADTINKCQHQEKENITLGIFYTETVFTRGSKEDSAIAEGTCRDLQGKSI